MRINKQGFSFIYLISIIFSIYFTGILATDCDVYKSIIGNTNPYKLDLDRANGRCCKVNSNDLKCDDQDNIIFM